MIREIRKNVAGEGQYRFKIISGGKTSRLVADFVGSRLFRSRSEQVNFEVPNKRVVQLGNDILNYFNKKARYDEWEPTMADLERKLGERYRDEGIYMWLIDWMRFPSHKRTAIRLYDWLKMAEQLGWFKEHEIKPKSAVILPPEVSEAKFHEILKGAYSEMGTLSLVKDMKSEYRNMCVLIAMLQKGEIVGLKENKTK